MNAPVMLILLGFIIGLTGLLLFHEQIHGELNHG